VVGIVFLLVGTILAIAAWLYSLIGLDWAIAPALFVAKLVLVLALVFVSATALEGRPDRRFAFRMAVRLVAALDLALRILIGAFSARSSSAEVSESEASQVMKALRKREFRDADLFDLLRGAQKQFGAIELEGPHALPQVQPSLVLALEGRPQALISSSFPISQQVASEQPMSAPFSLSGNRSQSTLAEQRR